MNQVDVENKVSYGEDIAGVTRIVLTGGDAVWRGRGPGPGPG